VGRGERIGPIGESSCGKSMAGLAVTRLMPEAHGSRVTGSLHFGGQERVGTDEEALAALRERVQLSETLGRTSLRAGSGNG
jgi:ABC-type dipeptide/oligopeptide/nickel transport system ATPase component